VVDSWTGLGRQQRSPTPLPPKALSAIVWGKRAIEGAQSELGPEDTEKHRHRLSVLIRPKDAMSH
jgi:hypothetical protein